MRRTPHLFALLTLCLFGGANGCFSFGNFHASDSGCERGGRSGAGGSTVGCSGVCRPGTCCETPHCVEIDRLATPFAGHVVASCGCAPVLACASQCILGDAGSCDLDGAPFGLAYLPCASCVLAQPLEAGCAKDALHACDADPECQPISHCFEHCETWPRPTGGAGGAGPSGTGGLGGAGASTPAGAGGAPGAGGSAGAAGNGGAAGGPIDAGAD